MSVRWSAIEEGRQAHENTDCGHHDCSQREREREREREKEKAREMERHAHFCGVRLIGVESRTVAVYRREKVRPTSVSRRHSVGVFVEARWAD